MRPIAHTPASPDGQPHDLEEHLHSVGAHASALAAKFGAGAWGLAAGKWHDLGKYGPDMQSYLHHCVMALRAGEAAPHRKIDHSTAGAQHAVVEWGAPGELLAFIIAGHHAGLTDYPKAKAGGKDRGEKSLKARLARTDRLQTALAGLPPDGVLRMEVPTLPYRVTDIPFFARMIFSTLIDADRIDTEQFYLPGRTKLRVAAEQYDSIPVLCSRLEAHMQTFAAVRPTKINSLRAQLLADCILASGYSPGLFSLTAPTGLGKTLAGLNFCLHHAKANRKRRVIYVAPFTSIIEQTASVYREALGSKNVLEHHSLFDPAILDKEVDEDASLLWRMSVENWSAPIVVTTAVQFFESLFSAHPSRCRKLHNIADSVVFLDEAQMIPGSFLYPILQVLTELMAAYGVSVVLSTATQPALDPRKRTMSINFAGLRGPEKPICSSTNFGCNRTEIVQDVHALHEATRRFKVTLPDFSKPKPTFDDMADLIATGGSSLTITNTRDNARELYGACTSRSSNVIHLSALMCPVHRLEIIQTIKHCLRAGETIRVISTQLVEAGVDLDFPDVYRALAGLDSLAQAGGRCNRNGLLEFGRLIIFESPGERLPPELLTPQAITRNILHQAHDDLFSPEMFNLFFRELFWRKGDRGLDSHGIRNLLPSSFDDVRDFCFLSASDAFRIIEDYREDVIVPWGQEGATLFEQLQIGPEQLGICQWRELVRTAQRYSVGLNKRDYDSIMLQGGITVTEKLSLLDPRFYHPVVGVVIAPVAKASSATD